MLADIILLQLQTTEPETQCLRWTKLSALAKWILTIKNTSRLLAAFKQAAEFIKKLRRQEVLTWALWTQPHCAAFVLELICAWAVASASRCAFIFRRKLWQSL